MLYKVLLVAALYAMVFFCVCQNAQPIKAESSARSLSKSLPLVEFNNFDRNTGDTISRFRRNQREELNTEDDEDFSDMLSSNVNNQALILQYAGKAPLMRYGKRVSPTRYGKAAPVLRFGKRSDILL